MSNRINRTADLEIHERFTEETLHDVKVVTLDPNDTHRVVGKAKGRTFYVWCCPFCCLEGETFYGSKTELANGLARSVALGEIRHSCADGGGN